MEPTLKTNTYERGTYYFFDCLNWRKVAKVRLRALIYRLFVVNFENDGKTLPAPPRNFTWSTTSWRRGLTCRRPSTTIQPSRPSKARPVQRPQLFLHTALLSRTGAAGLAAWFLFLKDSAVRLQGLWSPLNCPAFFWICILPKTIVPFLFRLLLFFLSCFEQGLCYVYVSESEAFCLPERRTDLVTEQRFHLLFYSKFSEHKVEKLAFSGTSEGGERNAMFIVALYLVIK